MAVKLLKWMLCGQNAGICIHCGKKFKINMKFVISKMEKENVVDL